MSFHVLDWLVFAAYLGAVLVVGLLASRRARAGDDELLLAGRSLPFWAVAISLLATVQSAATFIGGPQEAYIGDLTYLSTNVGALLAAIIVARLFVPAFYRHRVSSVYELLGHTVGRRGQTAAGAAFLLGRVMASGARLYIVALPFSLIAFGDVAVESMIMSIGVITVVVTTYVVAGGIRAVVWTDVLQCAVYVTTVAIALLLLCGNFPDGPLAALRALGESADGDKLKLLDLSTDPSRAFTVWSLPGWTLFMMAAYACDQDLAQRLLTCRTSGRSAWSLIGGTLIGWPVVALFLIVGLLLYVYYQTPHLVGIDGPPYAVGDDSRKVFLTFILNEMPIGMRGLLLAGLFAAAMSSMDSALNAMASSIVTDLLPRAGDRRRGTRAAMLVSAVALAGFATVCVLWQDGGGQTLIPFALGVMCFAYSGLLGVFLTATLTRRGNGISAIAALLAGALAVLLLRPYVALPWQMTIGTALAFGVCCAASRRAVGCRL